MKKISILALIFIQILFGGQIDRVEYFIDTDPGIGSAPYLSVIPGTEIDNNLVIPLSAVINGFHQLGLRVHDNSGKWSQTTVYPFYKVPKGDNIVKFEYFIESPGGSIIPGTYTPSIAADVDENFAITLPSYLSNGFYTLRIRSVDNDGQKSFYTIVPFYKVAVPGSNVTAAEYFFGADPGVGHGTAISGITAGGTIDFTFQANVGSLSNGIQTLRVRVRDDQGNWSIGESRTFLKEAVPGANITAAEYYIDNDPGKGMATNIPVTVGATADVNYTVPLTGLGRGIHHVGVRVKDDRGKWSLATVRTFLTMELPASKELVACEYFLDSDPGEGLANSVAITSGSTVDKAITVDLTGLVPGIHHVGVRVKYTNGRWSLATVRTFLTMELPASKELVACEYFLDSDPGEGLANSVAITSGSTVDKAITVDLTGLVPGIHHVGVRAKYTNGRWSLATVRTFLVNEISASRTITACEYFLDEDPGMGSATPVSITTGSTVEKNIVMNISAGMKPGFHKVGFRVKYDNGRWSATTIRPFVKREIQPRTNIVSIDYNITGDEGFSAGPFSYTSFAPDTNIDVHFNHDLSALEFGKSYILHMTAAEANGLNSFQYDHDFTVTIDTEAPATPMDFTAVSGLGKVTLTWQANIEDDLAKYKIYRGTAPLPTTILTTINYPTAADTVYVDNTVVSGQTYYYRMVAEDYDYNTSPYTDDAVVTPFWGPTWYVSTTGDDAMGNGSASKPYATIQKAINHAFAGNTIEVAAGTYMEDIDFGGKNLILQSANGATVTTIEGSGTKSVFNFTHGENSTSLVKGFTISNGSAGSGGAVYCNNGSSPRFKGLIVTGNYGGSGGGFYVRENSNVSLENVVITGNTSSMGGGLYVYNSSVKLRNVVIGNHSAVSIASAIYLTNSHIDIINCTIANNSANSQGAIYSVGSTINQVTNSIFWGNTPTNIAFSGGGAVNSVTVSYSDFENGQAGIVTNSNGTVSWGTGNLSVNPVFVDAATGNFAIKSSSPCINIGTPDTTGLDLPLTDAAGNSRIYDGLTDIIDMGAYEVQAEPSMIYISGDITEDTTWGADTIKVISDITVIDGKTLTIDPGVYVEFQGAYMLIVQGRLLAVGTAADSITFTLNPVEGAWMGIKFDNTPSTNDTSRITYAYISNAIAGGSTTPEVNGGGIYVSNFSKLVVSHSIINDNYAVYGGAVSLDYANPRFLYNRISGNDAMQAGGMLLSNSSPYLSHNVFTGNTSALLITTNSAPVVQNCTFYGNTNLNTINIEFTANPVFRNSIIWDNASEQVLIDNSSSPEFYYCDIENGIDSFTGSGSGAAFTGVYQNNIADDPFFVDAANGDFNLSADSPCIDAGDPAAQYNDPDGTRGDIGAYYYDQSLTISLTEITGEKHGDIQINYEISDYTQNVGLFCEYNTSPGAIWSPATVSGDTSQIAPENYIGSIIWHSNSDLPKSIFPTAGFRVTPYGYGPVSTRADSITLQLDNYQEQATAISFVESLSEYSDTIAINYTLTDLTGDTLNLSLHYQIANGAWQVADLVENPVNYSAAEYSGVLRWESAADLSGQDIPQVRIAAVANDGWGDGIGDTTAYIHIDNNTVPSVDIDELAGEQSGDIVVSYTLSDQESDSIRIKLYYADETDWSNWQVASITGDTMIYTANYSGSLTWNSSSDLPGVDKAVKLKMVPSDNDTGTADSILAFQLDNYQEQATAISFVESLSEYSDTIAINYTLTDLTGDTLNLSLHYQIANGAWQVADLVENPVNYSAAEYSGVLRWESAADLSGQDIPQVRIAAVANDGWGDGIGDTTAYIHIDNNTVPSVDIDELAGEQSGDIVVSYTLSDQESDSIRIKLYYADETDWSNWQVASITGDTMIYTANYSGSLTWNSSSDLPGVDKAVKLKMVPSDNDTGTADSILAFQLDNNLPPEVDIADITGEQKGDIPVDFTLTDAENDLVDIKCEYKKTGDVNWSDADVSANTTSLMPGPNQITWKSANDVIAYVGQVQFRITPQDNDSGTPDTVEIEIDQIGAPAVTQLNLDDMTEYSGDISVYYVIEDSEGDTVSLVVDFSLDNGVSWNPAMTSGKTTDIDSSIYTGNFTWNSGTDAAGVDSALVKIRVVPDDGYAGAEIITPAFHLDNNLPPVVTMPLVYQELSNTIEVPYIITDAEGDSIDLMLFYSIDMMANWSSCSIGAVTRFGPLAYSGNLSWNSVLNLPSLDQDSVCLLLKSSDLDPGTNDTVWIHLDNNAVPIINISQVSSEQHGLVAIPFSASDTEADSLTITPYYSTDSGVNWNPATHTVTTVTTATNAKTSALKTKPLKTNTQSSEINLKPVKSTIKSSVKSSELYTLKPHKVKTNSTGTILQWDSEHDIPNQDIVGLQFRIDVSDNDQGSSDIISFHVDNDQAHSIRLQDIVNEVSGDVQIFYTISDLTNDTIDIEIDYSIDNGSKWQNATTAGVTQNITSYNGSLIWNSATDESGLDIAAAWIRVIPSDGWAAGGSDTIEFHLDNNAPPVATLNFPTVEQHETIQASFNYSDPENDAVTWEILYSVDGTTFQEPSINISNHDQNNHKVDFVWNTANDMPGVDRSNVTLLVNISDSDPGTPARKDNIHVDNDQGSIALTDLSGEQSADVSIPYSITSSGSDNMSLTILYRITNTGSWQPATVSSAISGIGTANYNGEIVWQSALDLANQDEEVVWIKVIPEDDWAEGAADSIVMHVDNEIGPRVVSFKPSNSFDQGTIWNQSVSVVFDKDIAAATLIPANISITGTVSGNVQCTMTQDSSKNVNIIPKNYYAALETLTVKLMSGITDADGIPLDGNSNGDPDGSPTDDFGFSFRTTLLGDYDLDGEISMMDFTVFKEAILSEQPDYTKELGPVAGTLPHYILEPDGKYDLKDLMSLITMWNWSFDHPTGLFGSMSLAKPVLNDKLPVTIQSNYEHNGKWNASLLEGLQLDLRMNQNDPCFGTEIKIKYDPTVLEYDHFSSVLRDIGENWVVLDKNNPETGMVSIVVFQMREGELSLERVNKIGSLHFNTKRNTSTEIQSFERFALTTDDAVTFREMLSSYTFETCPPIPRQYALHSNYPNPFNPITNIRYELPNQSDVKLAVFNIRGEIVRWLVNKNEQPGYYEAVWDGKNQHGTDVASGIYFYRLQAGSYIKTMKMAYVK